MNSLLLTYMNNGILVSILVLLLFLFQKILKRYLSNICLYLCCIVLLLAYLIPFRPFAKNSLFTIMTPRVNKESMELVNRTDLSDSNLYTAYSSEIPSSIDVTKDGSKTFVTTIYEALKLHILIYKQQLNQLLAFLSTSLYYNLSLLYAIWTFGVFITFSFHVIKYYRFCKTIKRFTKPLVDQSKLELLHKNQRQLKVYASITYSVCSSIGSPITLGLLHPVIILPSYPYTEEELDYMLRHELIHIKRKDILMQWLLLICLSLHWWNPIIYLFIRLWKDFCESSCDSIVLNHASPTERMEYSKVLLKTALHQNQIQQLLFINFYGGKKRMKNRLQSILDTKHKKTSILTIMALALILCTTSIFSYAKENNITKEDPNEVADQVVTSSDLSTVVSKKDTTIETSTDDKSVTFSVQDFIEDVKTYEGASYEWGGNTPETGFDSSGFTQYIYSLYGYTLPRTSREQHNSIPSIDKADLKAGDLVFYANDEQEVSHVAIYLGDNQVIHAANPKVGVKLSSIDYRPVYSIGRVIQ